MEIWRSLTVGTIVLLGLVCFYGTVESCNEVVCASIVSKCMLTQSCKCELKNCSCCKECLKCLGKNYEECCSCVELCPKPNDTRNSLSKKSHVEDFDGVPELFNAVATPDEGDSFGYNWNVFTFQVDFDKYLKGPKLEKDGHYFLRTNDKNLDEAIQERDNIVTVNCTVIYLDQCVSWNKCRTSCQTTGASSTRWFHDGCCECVGSTCINYGVNESRCRKCPESKGELGDELDDAMEEEMQDFGESMGPFDGPVNNNY
ncbi:protein twisted gastrulation [Drosophila gunungcola]|uniref:protein twisted gastrulation n=1 Tax=Drosophila elegans TaxID=30023 RepID=UPI0007E74999|nr:protein twisted gastrulation [Drosophila elegans]XP_052856696.1 protein twisted gastrulation [Drosophila gunungcola]